jgi:hypothetical protein
MKTRLPLWTLSVNSPHFHADRQGRICLERQKMRQQTSARGPPFAPPPLNTCVNGKREHMVLEGCPLIR